MGTKPGDPLADATFRFAFAVTVACIRAEVASLGLELVVEAPGSGIFKPRGDCGAAVVLPIAYIDDLVLAVPADGPEQLLERLVTACSTEAKVCRRFGFRLSASDLTSVSGRPRPWSLAVAPASNACEHPSVSLNTKLWKGPGRLAWIWTTAPRSA